MRSTDFPFAVMPQRLQRGGEFSVDYSAPSADVADLLDPTDIVGRGRLESRDTSWRDKLKDKLAVRFGRRNAEQMMQVLDFTPAGAAFVGNEAALAVREGKRGEAAANVALAALPIPGAAKKGIKAAAKGAAKVVKGAAKVDAPITRFASVREGPPPERQLARKRIVLPETSPAIPSSVTGSFDATQNVPVTFRGMSPSEMTSGQMADFGESLGVPNVGPLTPSQSFPYEGSGGERFAIPGGTEGNFTLEDMFAIKGAAVDASRIDPELHQAIQRKIMRSMEEPGGALSDARTLSGLTFGYTSPNNPLTPNQFATARLKLGSQEDIDRLIAMRPFSLTDAVTKGQRGEFSDAFTSALGLDSAKKGGLGVRGSVDYSGYTDMLDLFRRDPAFFQKGAEEDFTTLVQRVASQVPGLSSKTGSFGVAWQPEAAVSAIDRHMAMRYMDTILSDPKKMEAFKNRALGLAQSRAAKGNKKGPESFDDINESILVESLLSEVGKAPKPKFRTSKGDISPNIPEEFRSVDFISEPEKLQLMGPTYKDVVAANEAAMAGSGLQLFGNQWNIWDRIRRRLEPHENMFPGLERLPRMSIDQLRVADKAHALSGHKNYGKDKSGDIVRLKPTRPVDYTKMRYFKDGGLAVKAHARLKSQPHSLSVKRKKTN
jgi:hypothetical protein